jgi:hypothetical protein
MTMLINDKKGGILLQKKEIEDYSLFLYSLKDITPKDKVKFIREFLGYSLSKNGKNYSYGGLLEKLKGIKVSNNSFLVPHENSSVVEAYLQSRGVSFVAKK